ncbi:putative transport-related membrane protein [Halobacteriovorax marinus SJ]|uniref:Transport-related membrane protein n=1 Tax=Halobacteriovorax marinus (strain ATCC BAA-682 / DSM 15412 / SJ) TaxID=862908 RepID=E1WX96_HALMS|nr:mechanosensitive ion channel domain-containing protein [Halobacteriovorax marinus]CBW25797.1 putative transport-related membrane protein [Halobacteriovorax marinus SJ]
MLEELAVYSYPLGVSIIFILLYLYFRLKIKRAEKLKLKNIKKREIHGAVETDSPVENDEKDIKERGIHAIEDRFSFISKALPLALFGIWSIVVFIPYLGSIPSVYISIIAAILSVIAGVSLRPFLENLFSGVVISFFKFIKIGDTVIIDDHYGLIEEIGLTYSIVKKWDWNRVVIPNSKLIQKEIQNLTINDQYIWAHIEFYVSPETDLEELEKWAKESPLKSKYFANTEEPTFWVMGLEKDSIRCWVAAWADNPSDAWELRNDMRTSLLKRLQQEGVSFHLNHWKTNLISSS